MPCKSLWSILLFTAAAHAQGVPVVSSIIDSNNSGDCKAIADLDGDGKGDLILGGSSLSWYETGASFAKRVIRSQAIEEFTTDMQAADVDGDGDIDIIIPDGGGSSNVLWYENPRLNPPSGVTSNLRVGSNWVVHVIGSHGDHVHDVEVADLDNDGKLDVVTSGHGFTHVWKQNSPTSWSDKNLSSLASDGVFLGDIDRDGFKDIATPRGWIRNPSGNLISGSWTSYPVTPTSSSVDECLLVDIDGDGRLDLLTCNAHDRSTVYWYQQPATATSPNWTRRIIDSSMGSHHPETADFNGDGRADLLMGLELQDLSIYINLGGSPPTFEKQQLDDGSAHNARCGDIDGDGMVDVFGCDYIGNPPAKVYINQLVGAPPCYANCDGSAVSPVLTANDFQCFINLYASGSSAANCDQSTVPPVLNANDFQCYLNKFATGCP